MQSRQRKRESQAKVYKKEDSIDDNATSSESPPRQWSGLSCKQHCCFSLVAIIIGFCVYIFVTPSGISPLPYQSPKLPKLVGPLAVNHRLTSAKRLFEGKIRGPEDIVFKGDVMYTGVHNGLILKIADDKITTLARLGKENCTTVPACGRVLGMRLDKTENFLIVVDAYKGLFKISLATGEPVKLFPKDDSFKVTFFDDLDILPNGDIILVEMSTRHPYHKVLDIVVENEASGRVILYSPSTGKHQVLAENLYASNGVQLHRDGESVLISETTRFRISRLYFAGPRKGQKVDFGPVLPGFPDNIRPAIAGREGYWVGSNALCHEDSCFTTQFLSLSPWIRNMIFKLVPRPILFNFFLKKEGVIVRLGENGDIVESLHDLTGNIPSVTGVYQHGEYIYTSSFFMSFIGQLKLTS